MYFTIYKITNKLNGKHYIGKHQTKNLNDGYMGSGKILKIAFKKYGIENFSKEILYIFSTEEEMNAKEKELVVVSEQTYNLCEGGKGGFDYINRSGLNNNKHDKSCRDKQRESLKKYWSIFCNKERLRQQLIEQYKTGKRPKSSWSPLASEKSKSKEAILKRKESFRLIEHQKGSKNSQYGTCWITNGRENKKIKKEELDIWLEKGYTKGRI